MFITKIVKPSEENLLPKELYYPGMWMEPKRPDLIEEAKVTTPLLSEMWRTPWKKTYPSYEGEKPFEGNVLKRYQVPEDIKRQSKEDISLTVSDIVPVTDDYTAYLEKAAVPQLPTEYPALAGLSEDTSTVLSTERGTWGDLISNLTTQVFGVEKVKAEAKLKEAEAKLVEAQPTPVFPWLIVAGIGLGILVLTKKKGG